MGWLKPPCSKSWKIRLYRFTSSCHCGTVSHTVYIAMIMVFIFYCSVYIMFGCVLTTSSNKDTRWRWLWWCYNEMQNANRCWLWHIGSTSSSAWRRSSDRSGLYVRPKYWITLNYRCSALTHYSCCNFKTFRLDRTYHAHRFIFSSFLSASLYFSKRRLLR